MEITSTMKMWLEDNFSLAFFMLSFETLIGEAAKNFHFLFSFFSWADAIKYFQYSPRALFDANYLQFINALVWTEPVNDLKFQSENHFEKEKREFFCSMNWNKCFWNSEDSLIAFDELQKKSVKSKNPRRFLFSRSNSFSSSLSARAWLVPKRHSLHHKLTHKSTFNMTMGL